MCRSGCLAPCPAAVRGAGHERSEGQGVSSRPRSTLTRPWRSVVRWGPDYNRPTTTADGNSPKASKQPEGNRT
jgi:hypothetical protein